MRPPKTLSASAPASASTSTSTSKPTAEEPTSNPKQLASLSLLRRAYSPETAQAVHAEKFHHRNLLLIPTFPRSKHTSPFSNPADARARRRDARNAKLIAQGKRRRRKLQPLSAAEKRRLRIYDIPKEEKNYNIYLGLHALWCNYIREIILGVPQEKNDHGSNAGAEKDQVEKRHIWVDSRQAGAKLAAADFHGAELEVVRSRCVGRVGIKGIVVRDTMFTFQIITKNNEIKAIPKEHTIFRFEIRPSVDDTKAAGKEMAPMPESRPLLFELHGEQFQFRAPDRANKKFKMHVAKDL